MIEDIFTYPRIVAFGECDPARIYFAPRAVDYAVEAIEVWFETVIGVSWTDLLKCHGLDVSFLNMECHYQRPLFAGQEIRLRVGVIDLSTDIFTLSVIAERGQNESVFQGKYVMCFVNGKDRGRITIPAQYRERIQSYHLLSGV